MFVSKPFFFFLFFFHVVFISWSFVHVCICSLSLICFPSKLYCTTFVSPSSIESITLSQEFSWIFLPWIRCRLIYQLTHLAKKKQRNINLHLHKWNMCLLSSNNYFSNTVFFTSTYWSFKTGTSWHKKKKKKKKKKLRRKN